MRKRTKQCLLKISRLLDGLAIYSFRMRCKLFSKISHYYQDAFSGIDCLFRSEFWEKRRKLIRQLSDAPFGVCFITVGCVQYFIGVSFEMPPRKNMPLYYDTEAKLDFNAYRTNFHSDSSVKIPEKPIHTQNLLLKTN